MGNLYADALVKNKICSSDEQIGLGRGEGLTFNPEVVVLAVKPQDFAGVIPKLKKIKGDKSILIISIMAGITIQEIERNLPGFAVIRAMPNAAVVYNEGMTLFCNSPEVTDEQASRGQLIFNCTGKSERVEDESLMDAVTAISGSGPAYFFYLAECLIQSAIRQGFKLETAKRMVEQTFIGAGEMVKCRKKLSMEDKIELVASKGGTTRAALNVFKTMGFGNIVDLAVREAVERGRMLGSMNKNEETKHPSYPDF